MILNWSKVTQLWSNQNQNQSRKISICRGKSGRSDWEFNLVRLLFPIASYSTSEGSQFHEIFAVKAFQRRAKLKGIKYLNVTNTHSAGNASTECCCNGNFSNILMENGRLPTRSNQDYTKYHDSMSWQTKFKIILRLQFSFIRFLK